MSNPIIVQMPSVGEQLAPAFDALQRALALRKEFQQREKDFQLKQKEFQLDQFRTMKAAEATDEQIANWKLEREQKKQEYEYLQQSRATERATLGFIADAANDIALNDWQFGSDEFNARIAELRSQVPPDPVAHKLIDAFTTNQNVLDKAEIDRMNAESQAQAAQAQVANAAVNAVNVRYGAMADIGQAALKNGTTYGQEADLRGLQIPEYLRNVNPAANMAQYAGTGGGGGNTMQQRALTFLGMMDPSRAEMEPLLDSLTANGENKLNALGDAFARSAPKSFWTNIAASIVNGQIPPEQQAVIAYMRNFVASWQYYASGAQINEGEYSRLVDMMFPRSTDSPIAIRAKKQMRDAAYNAIRATALGVDGPVVGKAIFGALDSMLTNEALSPTDRIFVQAQIKKAKERYAAIQQGKLLLGSGLTMVMPDGQEMPIGGQNSNEKMFDTFFPGQN